MNLRREQRGSPRASDAGPASRPAPHDSQLMPHCMAADAVVRTLKIGSPRAASVMPRHRVVGNATARMS